jgi:DNA invertase Pin-like site-specific DNA recombinase
MQMLAFLAEFERAMIPERTPLLWLTSKAGLAGAARSSTLSETSFCGINVLEHPS